MRLVARPVAAVALLVLAVVLGFSAVVNAPGASAETDGGDCTQAIKSGSLEWQVSAFLAGLSTSEGVTTWRNAGGTVDDEAVDARFRGTSVHFDEDSGAWLTIADPAVVLDAAGAGALVAEVAYGIAEPDEDSVVTFDPDQAPIASQTVEVVTLEAEVAVKPRTVFVDDFQAAWSQEFSTFLRSGDPASPLAAHIDDSAEGKPSKGSFSGVLSALPEGCGEDGDDTEDDGPTETKPPTSGAVELDDAVFRWGLNRTSNAMSHSGAYNFFSAGTLELPRAGMLVPKRLWKANQGNVAIQKWMGKKAGWQEAEWRGWRKNHKGLTNTTTGNFSIHNAVIGGGKGWVDRKKRRAEIQWTGSFTVVYYGGNSIFTVNDPALSVTGRSGKVTATLTGFGSAQGTSKWERLKPTKVTLADLSKVNLNGKGFTIKPEYDGVSVDLTDEFPALDRQKLGKGKGSFPPDMVRFLAQVGVAPYWYSSELSSGNKYKKPLPLTVSYDQSDEVESAPDDTDDSVPDINNPINDGPAHESQAAPAAPAVPGTAPGLPAQVPESQRQLLTPADLGAVKPVAATTSQAELDRTWWLVGSLLLVAAFLLFIPARPRA